MPEKCQFENIYSIRDKLSHLDLKFLPRSDVLSLSKQHGVHRVYSQLLILLGVCFGKLNTSRDIASLSSRSSFSVLFFVFSVLLRQAQHIAPWSFFCDYKSRILSHLQYRHYTTLKLMAMELDRYEKLSPLTVYEMFMYNAVYIEMEDEEIIVALKKK